MFDFNELPDESSTELKVTVTVDRSLGFSTDALVTQGCTIFQLKEQLSAADPTGSTKASEFALGLLSGGQVTPLDDNVVLTEKHTSLDVCPLPLHALSQDHAHEISVESRRSDTGPAQKHGRWKDLDGQAVGPWAAHGSKVKTVLFDCFSCPPSASRRLYTACWEEGKVCCWDVSKSETGKVRAPRLKGELNTGGFVGDIALLSKGCLVTALTGAMPEGGFVCHSKDWVQRQLNKDDTLQAGDALKVWDLKSSPLALPKAAETVPSASVPCQKIMVHSRGCRAISLWPRPECPNSQPQLLSSVSTDAIGVSRIISTAGGLEEPAIWRTEDPHAGAYEVCTVCWENAERLWSGDTEATIKAWDVEAGRHSAVSTVKVSSWDKAKVTSLEVWSDVGILAASHAEGITFVDTRASKVVRQQYTKVEPSKICMPNPGHTMIFAGVGGNLCQYDTRKFADGPATKPTVVGTWELPSNILSISCITSAGGSLLVAVGCEDGKVAALDTA